MNERYGRNHQQGASQKGSRGRYDDDRSWDEGYDNPRQSQQWHDESLSQQGGFQDDQRGRHASGQEDGYGSYRQDSSSTDGDRARSYGHDNRDDRVFGYGYRGSEQRGGQRDYRHEAGHGSRSSYGSGSYGSGQGGDFRSFTGSDFGGRDFSADAPAPYGVYGGYSGADRSFYGSQGTANWDRGDHRAAGRSSNDYGGWREYGESRGFFQRAGDEIASWFGDEDAARRRDRDHREDRRDDHRGRGPANYTRSDERIREDANDALTRDWAVDASEITVKVQNGEVTLDGIVHSRIAKRHAEDSVDGISGVKHVQNNLRVKTDWTSSNSADAGKTGKPASTTTGTTSTVR